MNETFTEFDPAEYLTSTGEMAAFITDALETNDSAYIAKAMGVVARAKGMADLAHMTGLSRESLYRSFSEKGNPTLKTVMAVMKALDIDIVAKPHAA
jgi:probable addiction module antidote protein